MHPLLSFKDSRPWFEEGEAIGSFLCSIGELEGHLFCTSKEVGELEPKHLQKINKETPKTLDKQTKTSPHHSILYLLLSYILIIC